MDRDRWPALPEEEQYEWEPPRTTQERNTHQRQRIAALGNAIVPQQIYPLLAAIVAVEQQKQSGNVTEYPLDCPSCGCTPQS